MTRDFNRDLTILVAGSGNATMAHLEESLGDWIFPDEETEREVRVILPLFTQMGGAIRNLIQIGLKWEFKFTVIQAKDASMTRELSALPEDCFVQAVNEREALELGLTMLTQFHRDDEETALLMAYNPKSTYEQGDTSLSDFEIIGDAKNYRWLTTLNLCEGMIDFFEGYKSTDEILKEERLKQEFEDKQRAEQKDTKPATKKAPAPRKRAAKKVEPPVSKPLVTEPEKPLQEAPENPCAEVADRGTDPNREESRKALTELSAAVPIVIGGPSDDMLNVSTALVRENLNQATSSTVAVSRDDLAELSENIKEMTVAFGNVMTTFTKILKDG